MRKLQRYKLFPAFACLLLMSTALGHGLMAYTVFCTNGSGHAAFELALGGTHAPCSGETGFDLYNSEVSSVSTFDSCSDVPVFKNESYRHRRLNGNPISGNPPVLSAVEGKISDSSIHPTHSPEKATIFPFPTLLSLRTQILII